MDRLIALLRAYLNSYYREYDAGGVRQSVNSDAGVDPLQAGYDADEPRYEGVGGRCAEADAERGGASDDAYPSDFALSRAMVSFTAR